MAFAEESALEKKEHFPVFLMGNSFNSYVLAKARGNSRLHSMAEKGFTHTNSRVELLVENPAETYIFNSLDRAETQAVFNTAQFFNMQSSGVRPDDLARDSYLSQIFKPIAAFSSHGISSNDQKFIAIAEGIEVPFYAFTYGLELTQFFFEDPTHTLDNFVIDHSIVARKHAQTVANIIADEARLCDNRFEREEDVYEKLIRHHNVAEVKFTWNEETLTNKKIKGDPTPKGMSYFDAYILQ